MTPDAVTLKGAEEAMMGHLPSVTVVVPSYNHEPFIERCLISIMRQTHAPRELIVIDDGSNDQSPRIIERALKNCPFPAELIVRPNKGLCATLNEGLARSCSKYFAYLSSDDVWLPQFVQKRVALLESQPDAVLAYGHAYLIDENDYIEECSIDWKFYTHGSLRDRLLQAIAPLSPTVLYRQCALERHGWNDQVRLEDYELYLRLMAEGTFAFGREVLGAWRRHWYNASMDHVMMMNEWLSAQERVATKLNICARELEEIQINLKFRCAEEFSRHGLRSEAMSLIRRNLKGAPSYASVARMAVRLMSPRCVIRWRKDIMKHQSVVRYGSLHGYMQE